MEETNSVQTTKGRGPDVGAAASSRCRRGQGHRADGVRRGSGPAAVGACGAPPGLAHAAAARSSVLVAHVPAASLGFGRAGPDAQGESEAPAAAVVAAA